MATPTTASSQQTTGKKTPPTFGDVGKARPPAQLALQTKPKGQLSLSV